MKESTLNTLLSLIVIGVITFFALNLILKRVDLFLRIKAINDCQTVARYERNIPEEDAKVYFPVPDQYDSCMKKKGF